jgi:hypothetical protein
LNCPLVGREGCQRDAFATYAAGGPKGGQFNEQKNAVCRHQICSAVPQLLPVFAMTRLDLRPRTTSMDGYQARDLPSIFLANALALTYYSAKAQTTSHMEHERAIR